jgi:squalene cyclase
MSVDEELLQRTLISGAAYILSLQDDDGSWVDWQLPPGESRPWTTAFVGYNLRFLPELLNLNVTPSIHAAARWLLRNTFDDGGWGYNELVGSDADSTAYAILLLSQSGEPIPESGYARLREFQTPDGGFSTYLPQDCLNSWGVSHPDVTPVALRALLTRYSRNEGFIQRGFDYVLRQRSTAGLWQSFWWESFLYSTDANLSLKNAIGCFLDDPTTKESLARVRPNKPFEIALQLSALILSGALPAKPALRGLLDHCVQQLVDNQQADGSWRSGPILRLTNRDSYEPWRQEESGPLFSDPNRLFTSSTVLKALSRVMNNQTNTIEAQTSRRPGDSGADCKSTSIPS